MDFNNSKSPFCGVFCDTLSFTLSYSSLSKLNNDHLDLTYGNRFLMHLKSWFTLLDIGVNVEESRGFGGRYYRNSCNIVYTSDSDGFKQLGNVYFDGNGDTVNFLFTGELCDFLNLHGLFKRVYDHLLDYDTKITRCDIAMDFINGEFDLADIRSWFEDGSFNTGGRPPKLGVVIGDAFDFDDGVSRTVYVGSRQSTKYFRAYEKGHQLGDLESKWVRYEIEYKANNGAELPLDLILNCASYFRDSYPAFESIPKENFFNAEPKKIRTTIKNKLKLTIQQCSDNVRVSYGRVLNMLVSLGHTPDQILQDLSRSGLPSRLVVPDMEPNLYYQDDESFGESFSGDLPI